MNAGQNGATSLDLVKRVDDIAACSPTAVTLLIGCKKLVILGATGRTGRLVAEQALARGHSVAAAREPRDSDQLAR